MYLKAEKVCWEQGELIIQSNKTYICINFSKDGTWKVEMKTYPHVILEIGDNLEEIIIKLLEKTDGTKWEYPNVGNKLVSFYDCGVEL